METLSALLALCAGNSPVPVNSPHKGQWGGALMFALICVWINGWVNNREAGDLRRNRAHYDVNVMSIPQLVLADFNWIDVTERVIYLINSKTYPVTLLCLIGIINSFWHHITSISIRIKFKQTRDLWQLGGLSIIQQFTRATVLQLRLFEHRRDCFRSICKRFIPRRVQKCWWQTM